MKSFEEKLQEVEKIVLALEEGKLSLEESMKDYETGTALLLEMEKELASMEQKLTVIRKTESGEYAEVPLTQDNSSKPLD